MMRNYSSLFFFFHRCHTYVTNTFNETLPIYCEIHQAREMKNYIPDYLNSFSQDFDINNASPNHLKIEFHEDDRMKETNTHSVQKCKHPRHCHWVFCLTNKLYDI